MTLSITKRSEALGAEIGGVDLSRPVSKDDFEEILAAWYENIVVVFPDQNLTNEQHIAFSERFGPLEVHPSGKYVLKDYPALLLLTNKRDDQGKYVSLRDGGSVWHSDLSYMGEPSLGSLLYSLEVPETGGDTEWANMYLAYDALPDDLKNRIDGLKAIHQFDQNDNPRLGPPPGMTAEEMKGSIWEKKSAEVKARTPDVIHPIVRTHPVTGRKALFVNRRFTTYVVDMDPDEGESLLLDLFEYAERRENIYRHKWRKNELVLWDNRCTIHLACGGFPDEQIRTMQRTTVRGEVPV
ncbi:MAG: taurine dioxygenase [Rhodospirillaceae bacterium]|nr:taurine dioxygenase [Rhodospirillaceae bacterium]|tara:strand:+ start:18043 stop:18930 length:888 start_codon:yes stop_codon:yes gene_type:complete